MQKIKSIIMGKRMVHMLLGAPRELNVDVMDGDKSQEITMELWRPRFASTVVRKQTGLV